MHSGGHQQGIVDSNSMSFVFYRGGQPGGLQETHCRGSAGSATGTARASATAPTITLRAAPNAIDRGQALSLQWEAKNATSVRIQPEVGSVQVQGSRSVSPASSVTYTAVATGPGGSASDSARITVRVPAAAAPTRPVPRADARV